MTENHPNQPDSDLSMTKCIEWFGRRNNRGYGIFYNKPAHRVIYESLVGPIPPDHDIHHLCRNHACVNPDHLLPLPHSEHLFLHAKQWPRTRLRKIKDAPTVPSVPCSELDLHDYLLARAERVMRHVYFVP